MSAATIAPESEAEPQTDVSAVRSAYVLGLLFVANLLNYADRSLLGIVVEPIRRELALSDTQISLVSGFAFVLFNLVAGVAIARWADRGDRRLILGLGVTIWSLATAATGLAHGFASLALCRMLVGVGEASVFPVALSLLADLYGGPRMPRAVSIFQASSGVGVVFGSILAGVLAVALGWRSMFAVCGLAGLVLVAAIALTLKVPPRVAPTFGRLSKADGVGEAIKNIFATPGMSWLMLGYGAANMTLAVLPTWAPAFLLRSHHVPLASVGAVIGPAAVVGGVAGTVLSGILATRLVRTSGRPSAGLIVPIVGLPLAIPAFALFLFAPTTPLVMLGIAMMNFMVSTALGPCVALAVGQVMPSRRALTSTLMLIVQTLLGFGLAPLIIGVLSDSLSHAYGAEALRHALSAMLLTPAIAAILIWLAQRRLQRAG